MSEENAPDRSERVRNLQSVRTVLEGLILAGVCWLGSSTSDQARATIKLETQMASMTEELRTLRGQLADIPSISRTTAKLEVRLEEHDRRITQLEHFQRN